MRFLPLYCLTVFLVGVPRVDAASVLDVDLKTVASRAELIVSGTVLYERFKAGGPGGIGSIAVGLKEASVWKGIVPDTTELAFQIPAVIDGGRPVGLNGITHFETHTYICVFLSPSAFGLTPVGGPLGVFREMVEDVHEMRYRRYPEAMELVPAANWHRSGDEPASYEAAQFESLVKMLVAEISDTAILSGPSQVYAEQKTIRYPATACLLSRRFSSIPAGSFCRAIRDHLLTCATGRWAVQLYYGSRSEGSRIRIGGDWRGHTCNLTISDAMCWHATWTTNQLSGSSFSCFEPIC